jgi:hypothetical protein
VLMTLDVESEVLLRKFGVSEVLLSASLPLSTFAGSGANADLCHS